MSERSQFSEQASVADSMAQHREMELTGGLLRLVVDRHPKLQPLADGRRFLVGYDLRGVWLSVEGATVAKVEHDRWWDAGLDTREDRAVHLAAKLAGEVLRPRINPNGKAIE